MMPDIQVTNHGTLFTFQPMTERGIWWLNRYVLPTEGQLIVCEHRFAWDIAAGAIDDGLEVQ